MIDICNKYAWVIPLKGKKGITITNAFQNNFKKSSRKPNKILVDKGSKSYNSSMKPWLEKHDMEMHSTHNEGQSAVTGKFIRTFK